MAFSTLLGLEKQTTGSNNSTWGDRLNDNTIELSDEAIVGVEAISVPSNVTLTSTDGVSNQARHRVHVLSGSGGYAVSVPNKESWWHVKNNCTSDVTYTAGATAATIRAGTQVVVYCDGTDCFAADMTLDQIKAAAGNVDLGSNKIINLTPGTASTDAATFGQITSQGAGVPFVFSTTTSDADPGSGNLRFNNATQSSTTEIYIDDEESGATDISALLATFDDSTSTVKGSLKVWETTDNSKWITFNVTGYTAASGYSKLTVAVTDSSAASPFADSTAVSLFFARTGDKGDTGATGPAGADGADGDITGPVSSTNNNVPRWSGTGGNSLSDGLAVGTSANNLVQLNGSSELPAVSGANLTNLPDTSGLVHIESQTASNSATIDFTTGIDGTYKKYLLVVEGAVPATDAVDLWFRASTDGGSTFLTTNSYKYMIREVNESGAENTDTSSLTNKLQINSTSTIGSDTNETGINANIRIQNPAATAYSQVHHDGTLINNVASFVAFWGGGAVLSSSALDAFRFQFSSGNIESGSFHLYGYRSS